MEMVFEPFQNVLRGVVKSLGECMGSFPDVPYVIGRPMAVKRHRHGRRGSGGLSEGHSSITAVLHGVNRG